MIKRTQPTSTIRATCNGWAGYVMRVDGYRKFKLNNGIEFTVKEKHDRWGPADSIVELPSI